MALILLRRNEPIPQVLVVDDASTCKLQWIEDGRTRITVIRNRRDVGTLELASSK